MSKSSPTEKKLPENHSSCDGSLCDANVYRKLGFERMESRQMLSADFGGFASIDDPLSASDLSYSEVSSPAIQANGVPANSSQQFGPQEVVRYAATVFDQVGNEITQFEKDEIYTLRVTVEDTRVKAFPSDPSGVFYAAVDVHFDSVLVDAAPPQVIAPFAPLPPPASASLVGETVGGLWSLFQTPESGVQTLFEMPFRVTTDNQPVNFHIEPSRSPFEHSLVFGQDDQVSRELVSTANVSLSPKQSAAQTSIGNVEPDLETIPSDVGFPRPQSNVGLEPQQLVSDVGELFVSANVDNVPFVGEISSEDLLPGIVFTEPPGFPNNGVEGVTAFSALGFLQTDSNTDPSLVDSIDQQIGFFEQSDVNQASGVTDPFGIRSDQLSQWLSHGYADPYGAFVFDSVGSFETDEEEGLQELERFELHWRMLAPFVVSQQNDNNDQQDESYRLMRDLLKRKGRAEIDDEVHRKALEETLPLVSKSRLSIKLFSPNLPTESANPTHAESISPWGTIDLADILLPGEPRENEVSGWAETPLREDPKLAEDRSMRDVIRGSRSVAITEIAVELQMLPEGENVDDLAKR